MQNLDSSINGSSLSNWKIAGEKKIDYKVELSNNIFSPDNPVLANACTDKDNSNSKKCLIVIDEAVYAIHKASLKTYFESWGIDARYTTLRGSEFNKDIRQAMDVVDNIIDAGLLRRSQSVVAIGGGVIMDIVGFAASLYRRGITYVRVPTTLMGQVDAGIGVKTGINYLKHKNRLGTYFAPKTNIIDPTLLKTLDQRHINNGVAEIIKMALIKDNELYCLLKQEVNSFSSSYFSSSSLNSTQIVYLAISGMLEELEPNLWEENLERIVDYGHTFSPSLELISTTELLHGEAVAVDMAFSLALAKMKNLISNADAKEAIVLIRDAGLPITHPQFNFALIKDAIEDTIKHRDGLLRMPLTNSLGNGIFTNCISDEEISGALDYIQYISANSLEAA